MCDLHQRHVNSASSSVILLVLSHASAARLQFAVTSLRYMYSHGHLLAVVESYAEISGYYVCITCAEMRTANSHPAPVTAEA